MQSERHFLIVTCRLAISTCLAITSDVSLCMRCTNTSFPSSVWVCVHTFDSKNDGSRFAIQVNLWMCTFNGLLLLLCIGSMSIVFWWPFAWKLGMNEPYKCKLTHTHSLNLNGKWAKMFECVVTKPSWNCLPSGLWKSVDNLLGGECTSCDWGASGMGSRWWLRELTFSGDANIYVYICIKGCE